MKNQFLVVTLSTLILTASLTACSSNAPRIDPGHLDVSQNVSMHSAKITNIVQLSEKEAPVGTMLLGGIAGMFIGGVLTEDKSDLVQDIVTDIGGEIGAEAVRDTYGKTIYHLTLVLDNGRVKQVHVRGGIYVVGRYAKITIDKHSGNITSLLAINTS